MTGTRHVIGQIAEFPEGSHRVVSVGRRRIGVFNIKGTLHALPNLCPHQTGPLCEVKKVTGTTVSTPEDDWAIQWAFDREIIACPWHGIEYHVPTGRCLTFPEISIRSYAVTVEDGEVSLDF
jgi:nitrite reductase (NADH) small subunit